MKIVIMLKWNKQAEDELTFQDLQPKFISEHINNVLGMKRRALWELQATAERQARQVDTKEKQKDDEGSACPGLGKVSVGSLSPGWDLAKKKKENYLGAGLFSGYSFNFFKIITTNMLIMCLTTAFALIKWHKVKPDFPNSPNPGREHDSKYD